MIKSKPTLFLVLIVGTLLGCTDDVQDDGDHGVAVEDSTMFSSDSVAPPEAPPAVEEAVSP